MSKRAVTRTVNLFLASVKEALPTARTQVHRSKARRSAYVMIYLSHRAMKVRVSDHAVTSHGHRERPSDLYIPAGATPDRWAVWLSEVASWWPKADVLAD